MLQSYGQIVPHRSLRHLQTEETNNNVAEARKRQVFMECIRAKLGDSMTLPSEPLKEHVVDEYDCFPYEVDEELPRTIPENEAVDARGKPISQQSVTDTLINNQVLLGWFPVACPKSVRKQLRTDAGRATPKLKDEISFETLSSGIIWLAIVLHILEVFGKMNHRDPMPSGALSCFPRC